MALKPLKLKRYVTEEDAAELLSSLIGEKVTAKDMEDYARQGIVPAYMQARSMFYLFGTDGFEQLIRQPGSNLSEAQARHSVAIVPWPQDDIVEDNEGGEWLLRAEGVSYSATAAITDEHYTRVYAPSEICKVAVLMNDPIACPEWPAVLHSQGHAFSKEGGEGIKILSYFSRPDIPEIIQSTQLSEKSPHVEPAHSTKLDPRTAESYRLMIYALALEAGYPLDQPAKAETVLKNRLTSLGINKLVGGKGTIQKHFEAALAEGDRAKKLAAE
ncbi:MAG TPA: hypothetical protein VLF15_10300 [Pseudoxanthomonas sp.]|nr:hypothetical protein [Pseudoxanthomonas sp.]